MLRPIQPPWWRPLQRLAIEAKRRRLKQLGIKPNCLLTREPLAFIHPDPIAFGFLPEFLQEHGYQIELHPDWRSLKSAVHAFLLDDSIHTWPSTFSPACTPRTITRLQLSWRSRLNESLQFEEQILNHAISLAEAEWK